MKHKYKQENLKKYDEALFTKDGKERTTNLPSDIDDGKPRPDPKPRPVKVKVKEEGEVEEKAEN